MKPTTAPPVVNKPAPELLTPGRIVKDAAARRKERGTLPGRRRPPSPEAPAAAPAPVSEEDKQFWGRQVQQLLNQIAELRAYPKITDDMAAGIGEPAALTARKYLPQAQERPEFILLGMLAPWITTVLRIEAQRLTVYLNERRAAADGRAPDRARADGPGEDGTRALPGQDGFTPGLA